MQLETLVNGERWQNSVCATLRYRHRDTWAATSWPLLCRLHVAWIVRQRCSKYFYIEVLVRYMKPVSTNLQMLSCGITVQLLQYCKIPIWHGLQIRVLCSTKWCLMVVVCCFHVGIILEQMKMLALYKFSLCAMRSMMLCADCGPTLGYKNVLFLFESNMGYEKLCSNP